MSPGQLKFVAAPVPHRRALGSSPSLRRLSFLPQRRFGPGVSPCSSPPAPSPLRGFTSTWPLGGPKGPTLSCVSEAEPLLMLFSCFTSRVVGRSRGRGQHACAPTDSELIQHLSSSTRHACTEDKVQSHMNDEAKRKVHRRNGPAGRAKGHIERACAGNLFSLVIRLLFFRPVWTEDNQSREDVRYVFVRFSAWHFAGSDMLWAGLVIQVCKALQNNFGKLQLGLFRVAQHDPEEDAKRKTIEDGIRDWRPKRVCCIPLWSFVLMVFVGSVFILVPLIILGFPQKQDEGAEEGTKESDGYGVLEGLAIAALGVPVVTAARFTFMLGKNLIFNQDINIRRGLDNKKVSEQLGLMHEVRKEVRLLSCFIHFMEVFERRKINVVLEITNLDRCMPEKIVGVLDAINILLSDEESPFISLVAVDPEVLAQKVDQVKGCISARDRAYALLAHIITLPFTIPPLCSVSKCNVFQKIVRENTVSMRRVISSIRVAIVVMEAFKIELPPPERVAAWVVLADRWPCRLSWILQCVEDEQQTLEVHDSHSEIPLGLDPSRTLWDVYNVYRVELHVIADEVEMFLERDDDPEMFEQFLKKDFKFTVGEMVQLKSHTVNLDYSIQNELARIRGRNRLKWTWKNTFNSLFPRTVLNMTVDDVCKESFMVASLPVSHGCRRSIVEASRRGCN
ncbi:hypothetical protein P4O66_001934 [Electrophorus voltai]|uniref:KAP NTPase domain-containing protein n=1 Tax=Electrophorus voltai TaxID=2609070 RepID=A0AAD9E619_9TELE|nr:hypothetical protein P4O66_001934 [Electrophorus voltai]